MKSVNSTNLASQLDASLTTDQSIDARKRPNSDLRLARVSRLERVLLLRPSLGERVVGCTITALCKRKRFGLGVPLAGESATS